MMIALGKKAGDSFFQTVSGISVSGFCFFGCVLKFNVEVYLKMLFTMMFCISAAVFIIGYVVYGRFMANIYGLSDANATPAVKFEDGVDYCPAHPAVLLGHHFASIAGAGPITGPIAAGLTFGWLPTILWCVIGSTFLGGPHDMGALVASMRHDGQSVGAVIEKWIGRGGKFLFLCFTILALILVVAVFQVMSAGTFVADPVVAFVSCLYIALAVVSGFMIYRWHVPLWVVTVVMLALIVGSCVKVNEGSAPALIKAFTYDIDTWNLFLSVYIFLASILPVWMLLQPRDYLASYFLYFAVVVGAYGMFTGNALNTNTIPMIGSSLQLLGFSSKAMWPSMFVIVACGAISGFHGLVGSGTTSKQLRKEKDAVLVGYGAMLIEGLVAVISIGTLMVIGAEGAKGLSPVVIFSRGFGQFSALLGMDPVFGTRLGAIAINSFLLTSLDTATRLTRYQIQEISGNRINKFVATFIAVGIALGLVYTKTTDATGKVIATWQAIWPIFGASNQLVAALTLLGIGVWISRGLKKDNTFMMIPFWFMLATTVVALAIQVKEALGAAVPNYLLSGMAIALLVLGVTMVIEGLRALARKA